MIKKALSVQEIAASLADISQHTQRVEIITHLVALKAASSKYIAMLSKEPLELEMLRELREQFIAMANLINKIGAAELKNRKSVIQAPSSKLVTSRKKLG